MLIDWKGLLLILDYLVGVELLELLLRIVIWLLLKWVATRWGRVVESLFGVFDLF